MNRLSTDTDSATDMDAADELASFRDEFYIPSGVIYMDGNSLGLLSKSAETAVSRVMNEWKRLGVAGWTEGSPPWFFLAEELAKSAAGIMGTHADETIVTNSTTVNLHQLLATLTREHATGDRTTILTDCFAFPSDAYAIDSFFNLINSVLLQRKLSRKSVQSVDGYLLDEDSIIDAMTPDVYMAVLPSVVYTSGQLLDMEHLTAEARRRGVLIGFDCSHSAGCVPHRLSEWGVDFAFWCSYKYLNGGPGATGGLYLNRRHAGISPGLAGWFSNRKESQLAMMPLLEPAGSAGALQIGTPNILSMAPLSGSMAAVLEAGIDRIRAKSLRLTSYLIALVKEHLAEYEFRVVTPHEEHKRGGHVALSHPEAIRICKALKHHKVIPDYRPPDIIRLCPVPLYNTFAECQTAVLILKQIMASAKYENYPADRPIIP